MSLDLSDLNAEQLAAVRHTEGPLLLLAGAGTGKTRALTYRIAYMICERNISPYQILAITFTNKAATEMRERLFGLLGAQARGIWMMTFHAFCARLLRQDAELLGYGRDFTIYDDADSKRLYKEILAQLAIDTEQAPQASIASLISQAKSELVGPVEYAALAHGYRQQRAAEVYLELEQRLKLANALDFDDLLMQAYLLLRQNPALLVAYQQRFRYLLIDEYQDTNHAQYQISKLLAAASRNIMVVGDDDQSIYSWRGADIRNILDFEKDYPEATVLKLEQNYRSTSTILGAANAVIANNLGRKSKQLYSKGQKGQRLLYYLASDERDEGRWIAAEILRLRASGHGFGDFALFYRTNAQSRVLEDMLLRAGVPYRIYGGTRFFDRQEIRDVVAYLKLIVNPADDVSAKRIINQPRRGLGQTTVRAIEQVARTERCSFMDACELALALEELPAQSRRKLGAFVQLIKDLRQLNGELRIVVEMIVEKSGLLDALRTQHTDEALARVENVQEFFTVAAEFETGLQDDLGLMGPETRLQDEREMVESEAGWQDDTQAVKRADDFSPRTKDDPSETTASAMLPRFMEWLALRSDLDTIEASGQHVTLMTVHSAKGLEFKVVFLAGMEEALFPHQMSLLDKKDMEEERRLAYVAITRARELLYISRTQRRTLFGYVSQNPESRFVREIPAKLIESAGLGSQGLEGSGFEKRGSRRGIFGSGQHSGEPDDGLAGNLSPVVRLDPGDLVDHRIFGRGRVIAVRDDIVEVSFEKGDRTRKLVLKLAPLVKIGG
ncbi:MAG: UvrD-helicase domain-containing protein [Coriobacteriales bacterium]|jgi:DNA helicase-2/ATP-dependent DNA helicase PcrA|nr:UvrD-helicase domain-containing protein [Coriobacteriales bacterium]